MSHEQRESKRQGRQPRAMWGLSTHIVSSVYRSVFGVAEPAPGVGRRRRDWCVCSVGGCEPRGIA